MTLAPDQEMIRNELWTAVANLPEREQAVLEGRLLDGKTLKEMGKEFGICGQRVREIQAKALSKLRWVINGRGEIGVAEKAKYREYIAPQRQRVEPTRREFFQPEIILPEVAPTYESMFSPGLSATELALRSIQEITTRNFADITRRKQ